MKMSSSGTYFATENNKINSNEDLITPEGENFSLSTYSTMRYERQSESYDLKKASRQSYYKNLDAKRRERLKDIRRSVQDNCIPKVSNKKRGTSSYVHQSSSICNSDTRKNRGNAFFREFILSSLPPFSPIDTYVPQARFEYASQLDTARSILNLKNYTSNMNTSSETVEQIMSVVEVFAALSISLQTCTTKLQFASQIVLAIRSLTQGSITARVFNNVGVNEWFLDTFGFNLQYDKHSEVEMADDEKTSWLTMLGDIKGNWTKLVNCPMFGKVSALLTVLTSIGLCSVSKIEWSVGGVELFRPIAAKKHCTAIDFITAVLDTVVYFVEVGVECFKKRSFKPIFCSDGGAKELDEAWFVITMAQRHAELHLLDELVITELKGKKNVVLSDLQYVELLRDTLEKTKLHAETAPQGWYKGFLMKRYDRLVKYNADYHTARAGASLRFAPYTTYIWGDSGVGKSTLSQLVATDMLTAFGEDPDPKFWAYLKEHLNFDVDSLNNTTCHHFDDAGNTKKEFRDKTFSSIVIDVQNNVTTKAHKADVAEKGKVLIASKIFNITSNAPCIQHAKEGSIEPFSIVRRMHHHVHLSVKPEFAMPDGRLDDEKVAAVFGPDKLINDVWNIKLYVPLDADAGGSKLSLIGWDGSIDPAPMSVDDFMLVLINEGLKYFGKQKRLLKNSKKLVAERNYCTDCKYPSHLCMCPRVYCGGKMIKGCGHEKLERITGRPQPTVESTIEKPEKVDSDVKLSPVEVKERPTPIMSLDLTGLTEEIVDLKNRPVLDDDGNTITYSVPEEDGEGINLPDPTLIDTSEIDDFDKQVSLPFFAQKKPTLTKALAESLDRISDFTHNMLFYVPNSIVESKYVEYIYLWYYKDDFLVMEQTMRTQFFGFPLIPMIFIFVVCDVPFKFSLLTILFALLIISYLACLARWRKSVLDTLYERKDVYRNLVENMRRKRAGLFCATCTGIMLIYTAAKLMRRAYPSMQSALSPESPEEIDQRDKEVNPWATAEVEQLHLEHKAETMTHEQMVNKVSQHLYHGVFTENNFQQQCDLLAISGNVFLAPLHLFQNRKEMKALLTRKESNKLNSTVRAVISVKHIIPVGKTDLALVFIPSAGVHANIIDLFPNTATASGSADFLYRKESGELMKDRVRITYTRNSEAGGPGFDYKLPYNTFTGLCMGTLVANFAKPFIAGVHLRGITGRPNSKALTVTRDLLNSTLATAWTKWESVFPSHANGTFPTTRYDLQMLSEDTLNYHATGEGADKIIHPFSPVNYMPIGSTIDFLGQGGTRISHTSSKVRKTPISKTVTEVTGVPCNYGPPRFESRRMWQASLAHSANPSPGVEGDLLDWAFNDYTSSIISKFQEDGFVSFPFKSELKPLTPMETLCGRDGKRFIDAMKKSTSKGYPLSGPKSSMITLLNPDAYPEFQCPAMVDPIITDEMARMEEDLLNGKRCYSVFKACVKDEPTKIGKDKVRVFQAADWAFQMIVRKYYLPLARHISLFPLLTECAVGVNAQGPEWHELATFMKRHGDDRIFAGDYSKYDLRMPAQLILAAFKALMRIGEECGSYTPNDLKIMQGIATEVAYSCVAYNGDMLIHCGSNPSGQNLTVYINCIVNSLLLRCAYRHLGGSQVPPFRSLVSVMTYGDDVKGSVSTKCTWFDHIKYAKFMKERDMVFTMPDKESVPTPFMKDEDADFLKRKNIWNSDTNMYHGALDEDSIFKSLHTVLESRVVSLEDQAVSNIDGGLREWWQHGREIYEKRREQMKKVAHAHNMQHLCQMLDESYEDRLAHFKHKYMGEENVVDDDVDPEFVHTVSEWGLDSHYDLQSDGKFIGPENYECTGLCSVFKGLLERSKYPTITLFLIVELQILQFILSYMLVRRFLMHRGAPLMPWVWEGLMQWIDFVDFIVVPYILHYVEGFIIYFSKYYFIVFGK